jgi:NitT/TauT family transport system permease protein
VLFVAVWELAANLELIDAFFFSSPSRIAKVIVNLSGKNLFYHVFVTLFECLGAFAISTALGFAIAVLLWWSETLRKILDPYVVILNALPKIALGPLIIIWVGSGTRAIVTMGVLICVIVTIINVLTGFLSTESEKIFLLRSLGASKFQILTKLVLPSSTADFVSALKVNIGLAWVGTIMGEYLVSGAGLGYLIIYGGAVFNLDLVMSSTVVLCLLAGGMYFAVTLIEKAVVKK